MTEVGSHVVIAALAKLGHHHDAAHERAIARANAHRRPAPPAPTSPEAGHGK